MEWMHWTVPSAIGFATLFVMLCGLAYLDKISPSYGRKGFLPIVTTRGDRVFMAIVSLVLIFFLWLKFFPEVTLWGAGGGLQETAAIDVHCFKVFSRPVHFSINVAMNCYGKT